MTSINPCQAKLTAMTTPHVRASSQLSNEKCYQTVAISKYAKKLRVIFLGTSKAFTTHEENTPP